MKKSICRVVKIAVTPLALLAILPGCARGVSNLPSGEPVKVYKSLGSVQCSGGGKSLDEIKRQLKEVGIPVGSANCGIDGNMHAAMCGAPDGRIAIVEIPESKAQVAAALGFLPLKNLPDATEVPCKLDFSPR